MTQPYDRTTYDGNRVDWLTRAALEDAARDLGYADGLTVTQGSYNAGAVSASGGTHDGGGVVDLSAFEHERKVPALRRRGFAAWYRPELWRNGVRVWPAHIHAVQIGNAKLAPVAKRQVSAYLAGKDGLAGNGPDNGTRKYVDRRYTWKRGAKRITRARSLIARANAILATGVRGYNVTPTRNALRQANNGLPKA